MNVDAFQPLHLSQEENEVIDSILSNEESELKDSNFSIQSNISAIDEQFNKIFKNWDQDVQHYMPSFSPKYQAPNIENIEESPIKINETSLNQSLRKSPINTHINSDIEVNHDSSSASNLSTSNRSLLNFDFNSLKAEVDDLMSQVRSVVRTGKQSTATPNSSLKEINKSLSEIKNQNGPGQSSFQFQSGNNSLHVEFPNIPRASFLKNAVNNSQIESEDDQDLNRPFSIPSADFPDSPEFFEKGSPKKMIDTSKQDRAQLKDLRKENINLKTELLKLEKRLQLEEEEHKKLLVSLEKSEKLCELAKAKLANQK